MDAYLVYGVVVPPYWTPGGVRIHYITKGCDTNPDCERKKDTNKLHCKRDWWNDWTCYDCCNGPKCNYYVTVSMVPGIKVTERADRTFMVFLKS